MCNKRDLLSSFKGTATKKNHRVCPIRYLLSSASKATVRRKWPYMESIATACLSSPIGT